MKSIFLFDSVLQAEDALYILTLKKRYYFPRKPYLKLRCGQKGRVVDFEEKNGYTVDIGKRGIWQERKERQKHGENGGNRASGF